MATPEGYWHHATRPLVSLAFVTPVLLVYEFGVLVLGPEAMRNGADVWLREFLDHLGFGQYFLLPLSTCGILLGWHHVTQFGWRLPAGVLSGMMAESAFFGTMLLGIAQLQGWLFAAATGGLGASAMLPATLAPAGARMVGFFGAGVYEELLFRLILLPAIFAVLQSTGESRRISWIGAIVISSLVFSAAHFRLFTPWGDPFCWFSFLFRVVAGVFFSVLFLCRGFGITVGAHTLYDILVGLCLP